MKKYRLFTTKGHCFFDGGDERFWWKRYSIFAAKKEGYFLRKSSPQLSTYSPLDFYAERRLLTFQRRPFTSQCGATKVTLLTSGDQKPYFKTYNVFESRYLYLFLLNKTRPSKFAHKRLFEGISIEFYCFLQWSQHSHLGIPPITELGVDVVHVTAHFYWDQAKIQAFIVFLRLLDDMECVKLAPERSIFPFHP